MKAHYILRIIVFALTIFLSSCSSLPSLEKEEKKEPTMLASCTGKITTIDKFGNAILNIPTDTMAGAGFAFGDLLHVSFDNGFTFNAPYLSNYDVQNGSYMVMASSGTTPVCLSINYGNLAKQADLQVGTTTVITLLQKQGYRGNSSNYLAS